jgi:hypothetical protein
MTIKKKEGTLAILQGIVLPSKWDKDGRVMRISLNTKDENEYIIDYSGKGKELLNHLRTSIKVEGKVLQRIGGAFYIKVNSFSPINEPDSTLDVL